MASQLLRIQMAGGGPYGFRLLGGDKNPLTVAKIRPSSKAQVTGLLEGDVILALNNISSQGLSHPAATSLMEGNNAALIVHVLRGINASREVDSAMATLGAEVKRLTAEEASALQPGPSATSGSDQVMNGSEPYFRLQAPPSGGSLKQLRIARRESQSGDIIETPVVAAAATAAAGLSSENSPGYYAREERTSTDGGKTTRIVEEVKTEKFGGTTLTKVTKQEFSSYKSSSGDPRVVPFPPEFSVGRGEVEEEHGHPVPLGGSSDGGGGGGGGSQLRDERGWKTTTSVHKSSVRTEPYEVRIDTTQEPTKTYIIYQDGSREDLQRPHDVVGRGQQPIPAIEVQFHPSESDFVVHAKPPRVGANPNFEIRVGKEVTFQPKAQTSYEATQSHSEFHPTLKVHEPGIPSQSGTYSTFSHESNQTNYATHPHEPQSGYLVKQTTRTQPKTENRSESHSRYDSHQQFGHTSDSRPPPGRPTVRFSAEPEYSDAPSAGPRLQHAVKLHPDVHFRPGNDNPDPRNKPGTNSQLGYISESQPIIAQFHLGYNPVPQPSSQARSGYYVESQPGTHSQRGYSQELQPEISSQLEHNPEPQPRTQSQYGYNPESQPKPQSQYGYNPDSQPKPQSQYGGYNPEPQPKPQSQYGGYNPEPQPKPQSQYGGYNPEPQPKPQSQYGGYNPEPQPKYQSQHGYNKEQHPNTHDQFGYSQDPAYPYQPRNDLEYESKPKQQQQQQQQQQQPEYNKPDSHFNRPEQDHATNPQYGYNSQQEPHLPPSQPTYNPEPKHKAAGAYPQKTYEPEPPAVEYDAYPTRASAAPFSRQAEAPFYDKAPATHAATPPQWGKKLPQGPGGPGSYNPPEGVYTTKPSVNDRGPPPGGISRQLDRIERVEIASAPKWIPGSKLPTKQPSKVPATYNSHPPPTGDPRGLHPNNTPAVSADGYYDQSPEGGWHEAPVAGVKNRPNVSFSRVHDPTKQSGETDQSFEYGSAPPPNLKYGGEDSYYGREAEESGQYGWPESSGGQSNPSAAGQYPAQGNVWRPSGYGPSVVEERVDRSRGFGDGPAPPPPPPAPPLVPGGFGSTQPVGFCVEPTPLAPPPPVAPPIDLLKAYRGHSSSDQRGGYGSTSLEERVKMANSVAHSVLAPENQHTRGQKMFLRRREHSHKWTFHGPDPVPEEPSHQDQPARSNTNAWAPKTAGPAQPRPPPALGPQQQQGRPPAAHDYPEINGRPEKPPSGSGGGGSASSYSLAEDMVVNSGKGGRLFAKRVAKADQWASAETTGRQGTPIRQGAPPPPQSQTGYGSVAVPPGPGYDGSSYGGLDGGGKGVGDGYPVANRLKDMIKTKSTTVIWNQQSAPQSPFAQGGSQATGPSLISAGSSNPNPGVYRQVRFQGTSAISSSPAAVQNFTQAPRFTPKQFGNRATVSQAAGVTDL